MHGLPVDIATLCVLRQEKMSKYHPSWHLEGRGGSQVRAMWFGAWSSAPFQCARTGIFDVSDAISGECRISRSERLMNPATAAAAAVCTFWAVLPMHRSLSQTPIRCELIGLVLIFKCGVAKRLASLASCLLPLLP